MVIGENFIWMHIAKIGGMYTRDLFETIPANFIVMDNRNAYHSFENPTYIHDSITSRKSKNKAFSSDGKSIVLNIRRLPGYIRSFNVHVINYNFEVVQTFSVKLSEPSRL